MFTEEHDRHTQNGGTSAACAIAAGVVAALRERWGPNEVSPEALKMILRKSAVRPGAAQWDERIGTGIINAEKALMELSEPS
jgi:hypothetical protein